MVMIALNTIVLMMKVSGLLLNLCNFRLENTVFAVEGLCSHLGGLAGISPLLISTSDLPHVGFRGHGDSFPPQRGGGLVVIRPCEWELDSARASCTEQVRSLGVL